MKLTKIDPSNARDTRFLYDLLKSRPPHINISHRKMPSYADHCRFWLSEPYPWARMILDGRTRIGYAYVTKSKEVGIFLAPDYQGKGIGAKVLDEVINGNTLLYANIAIQNNASRKLFTRAGFVPIAVTYRWEAEAQSVAGRNG